MSFMRTMALGAVIQVDVGSSAVAVSALGSALNHTRNMLGLNASGLKTMAVGLTSLSLAGAAVTGGLSVGFDAAARFENQMAAVRAVSDLNATQFAALQAKAKELGATTKFTATEVGEGMEIMQRAGFTFQETLDGIEGVLAAAAAEGMDLAAATDIVGSALRAFSEDGLTSIRMADILAKASAVTNASITSLGEALKFAAPSAHLLGVGAVETTAALGALGDAGLQGTVGGRGLAMGMTRLVSPTKKAQKMMDQLGFTVVKTDEGTVDLVATFEHLGDRLNTLKNPQDKLKALSHIFGQESLKSMAVLADRATDVNRPLRELVETVRQADEEAKRMADTRLDSFTGQVTILKSAIEGLAIEVFQPLLDPMTHGIKAAAEAVQELVQGFNGLGDSVLNYVGRGLATGVMTVTEELKEMHRNLLPMLGGWNSFATSIGPAAAHEIGVMAVAGAALMVVLTPIVTALAMVAGAAFLLGDAFLPIVVVVGVGLAGALGVVGMLLLEAEASSKSFFDFMNEKVDRAKVLWGHFKDQILALNKGTFGELMQVLGTLGMAWDNFMIGVNSALGYGQENVMSIVGSFGILSSILIDISVGLLKMGANVVWLGSELFKWVIGPMTGFATGFAAFLSSIVEAFALMLYDLGQRVMDNPFSRFAAEKMGLDGTAAQAWLDAKMKPADPNEGMSYYEDQDKYGYSYDYYDEQSALESVANALGTDAENKASASSPDVAANVTVEDKRKICIENELTLDGRQLNIAQKEAEIELTERSGFSITPWQKRQILERGAVVLGGN